MVIVLNNLHKDTGNTLSVDGNTYEITDVKQHTQEIKDEAGKVIKVLEYSSGKINISEALGPQAIAKAIVGLENHGLAPMAVLADVKPKVLTKPISV
jgi:hypothetical protein